MNDPLQVECSECRSAFVPDRGSITVYHFDNNWYDWVGYDCPNRCEPPPGRFVVGLPYELFNYVMRYGRDRILISQPAWCSDKFRRQFEFDPADDQSMSMRDKRKLVRWLIAGGLNVA